MNKIFELPLTRNYVSSWTAADAIRELLQNALDYGHGKLDCKIGESSINEGTIQINSDGARLDPKTLLLGQTTKAEDKQAIGSFGEGYKIALLVLAREGINVVVFNGGVKWTPRFGHSESFGAEVLMIDQEMVSPTIDGVAFAMTGLSGEVIEKVKANTLQLQGDYGDVHETKYGQILLGRPGSLYVNGLYVTNTNLAYGYNIKPEFLKMNRDRQTVSSFDLKWTTKDMWFDTAKFEEVSKLIEAGTNDLEYANYGCPELVKEACYKRFTEKHPGAVIASSQADLEQLVSQGMTSFVYGDAYKEIVESHEGYAALKESSKKKPPKEVLQEWFDKNGLELYLDAKQSFAEIIKISESWK